MSSPIEGYEDIHKNEPYIDAESFNGSDVAHVFMLYVPPQMRGQGVGKRIFCEWFDRLPASVKRVRLKACTLGGSDGLAFWKKLDFTEAFFGDLHHEIENTLVLGVNGYSNPVIERIQAEVNRDRHWIEELEDVHHLRNNPQVLTIKSAEHLARLTQELRTFLIAAKWVDSSWGNDVYPSFESECENYKLWIDCLNPTDREHEHEPRFSLFEVNDKEGLTSKLWACEEVSECVSRLQHAGLITAYS